MIERRAVLDHGFVELVDLMGNDWTPVEAARISIGEGRKGEEIDRRLLRFLQRNRHETPFEMVEALWRVRVPIFVAREWLRHRTANVNEFSMRYEDARVLGDSPGEMFYIPDHWRSQATANQQGSSGPLEDEAINTYYRHELQRQCRMSWDLYQGMLAQGIAREQARMVLPVNTYTLFLWKNDLRNTLHFLNLRNHEAAQWEIRQYAEAMEEMLDGLLPETLAAWREYRVRPG